MEAKEKMNIVYLILILALGVGLFFIVKKVASSSDSSSSAGDPAPPSYGKLEGTIETTDFYRLPSGELFAHNKGSRPIALVK